MNPQKAIIRSEVDIIKGDPTTPALLFVAPLVLIALLHDVFAPIGSVMAAPAYALLFAFMIATWVIYTFFKEFGWATWPRLRASGLSVSRIVVAKLLPYVALGIVQQATVLGLGLVVVGEADELVHLPLLVVVSTCFVTMSVSFGFLLAAVTGNHMQASTIANLVVFVLAAIGGALAPVSLLPGWAQAVSPASPHRWAMEAFEAVLEGGSIVRATAYSGLLLLLAAAMFVLASWRFDEADDKEFAY